jgi:hypothetical protein
MQVQDGWASSESLSMSTRSQGWLSKKRGNFTLRVKQKDAISLSDWLRFCCKRVGVLFCFVPFPAILLWERCVCSSFSSCIEVQFFFPLLLKVVTFHPARAIKTKIIGPILLMVIWGQHLHLHQTKEDTWIPQEPT